MVSVFPQFLKVYPDIAVAALSTKRVPEFSFWTFARGLDENGRGLIPLETFRKTANFRLAISSRQINKTVASACDLGLLKLFTIEKSNAVVLHICSLTNAAIAFGVPRLIRDSVFIPVDAMINTAMHKWTWTKLKANLWASYLVRFSERPISREILEALSGIPPNTQRNYERLARVRVVRDFAVSDIRATPDMLSGYRRYGHKGTFLVTVKRRGKVHRVLAWPLPNSFTTNLETAPRGQLQKVNRRIGRQGLLLQKGGGQSKDGSMRRFFSNMKDAIKAAGEAETGEMYVRERRQTQKMGVTWSIFTPSHQE